MQTTPSTPSFMMLAPMEGVVDPCVREIFSAIGGIDRCVTEFVRVTQQRLPARTFYRYCPELKQQSRTQVGTPVYVQLLGDHPEMMAANAVKAVELGAMAIDINFGCPAKSVNNHGGGAVLLTSPDTLYAIAHCIRSALADTIPLTAKVRLGFADKLLALDNAHALEDAGIAELTVHGRTKVEGYKPPAYWDEIGKISQALTIPVIANGEIWNLNDLQRCMEESYSSRIMLGRGLIACPDLALMARDNNRQALHWGDISLLLCYYFAELTIRCDAQYISGLVKQWLVYLRTQYADAFLFFEQVKRINDANLMRKALHSELIKQNTLRDIQGHIGNLDLRHFLQQTLTNSDSGYNEQTF